MTVLGKQEPSVRICPDYTVTDGADAEKLLAVGGLILDPWQADALADWMAMTPGQKWICRTCGLSIPRQNGKTAAQPQKNTFQRRKVYGFFCASG